MMNEKTQTNQKAPLAHRQKACQACLIFLLPICIYPEWAGPGSQTNILLLRRDRKGAKAARSQSYAYSIASRTQENNPAAIKPISSLSLSLHLHNANYAGCIPGQGVQNPRGSLENLPPPPSIVFIAVKLNCRFAEDLCTADGKLIQ